MIKNYILILILTILMLSAFGYGIFRSGSPFETRGKRFDEQRVSDISTLSYSIENYYRQKNRLPQTLSEIPKDSLYGKDIKDPESNQPYGYQVLNNTNYKLCADFSTDSSKSKRPQDIYSLYGSNAKFQHPQGNYCFDLNTEGIVLNPTAIPSPSVQNLQSGSADTSELTKRGRDAARLSDLSNLQNAINVYVQEATSPASTILCATGLASNGACIGKSLTDGRGSNGTGWIKVNLASQRSVSVPTLPVDPINDGLFHYAYCSDGNSWEINATLESSQQQPKMASDGGDENSLYEVGSNLTLIGNNGKCRY